MKEVFALDVDGVVLDIVPGALKYVADKYGVYLEEDDVTDWDWDYIWSLPEGLSSEFWTHVWNTPALPYAGAVDFVEELRENFHVIAISTRPEEWKGIGRISRDAGERDFPQFGFDEVHFVDKHVEKVKILNDTKAMFFVEDNPKNAMLAGLQTDVVSFLMTRPWNARCLTVNEAWERVDSYDEIFRRVAEVF